VRLYRFQQPLDAGDLLPQGRPIRIVEVETGVSGMGHVEANPFQIQFGNPKPIGRVG